MFSLLNILDVSLCAFIIFAILFTFSWIIYDYLILTKIDLRAELFKKDNLAVWIEFIFSFLVPILLLITSVYTYSPMKSILTNIIRILITCSVYISIFFVLRYITYRMMNAVYRKHGTNILIEVFIEKSIASAILSSSLSLFSIIATLTIKSLYTINIPIYIAISLLLFYIAHKVFNFIFTNEVNELYEILSNNNIAVSLTYSGFILTSQYVLYKNLTAHVSNGTWLAFLLVSLISISLYFIIILSLHKIIELILKIDICKEIYKDKNTGVGIFNLVLFIGISILMTKSF